MLLLPLLLSDDRVRFLICWKGVDKLSVCCFGLEAITNSPTHRVRFSFGLQSRLR